MFLVDTLILLPPGVSKIKAHPRWALVATLIGALALFSQAPAFADAP
jgi:hypothetical protein